MKIFKVKLQYLAHRGFDEFAQVIYSAKLPHGFAEIILNHYLKNIDSAPISFPSMDYIINNFVTINGLNGVQPKTQTINMNTMLNVKMTPKYLYSHIIEVSRLMFNLLNAGQVSMAAAIVYLQRFTPDYINRVVYGVFRDKVMFWLHPDVGLAPSVEDDVNKHICKECMYGNFNHYDIRLATKISTLERDMDYNYSHIAYTYKYINYW